MYENFEFQVQYDFNLAANVGNASNTGSTRINSPQPTEFWGMFTQLPFFGDIRIGNQKPLWSFGNRCSAYAQMICDAVPCEDCAICQLVPDVKKTSKAVFSCKTIYYCEHRFPGLHQGGGCFGTGDDCESQCCPDCIRCGKVRSRRVLLKKFVTEEEHILKCEVSLPESASPCPACQAKSRDKVTPHTWPRRVTGAVRKDGVERVSNLAPIPTFGFRKRD